MALLFSGIAGGNREKRAPGDVGKGVTINDEHLEFTLGFKLDGVPAYKDLEVRTAFRCTRT